MTFIMRQVSECNRCKSHLQVLQGMMRKGGLPCVTAAGENSAEVMALAVKDCAPEPSPEPIGPAPGKSRVQLY